MTDFPVSETEALAELSRHPKDDPRNHPLLAGKAFSHAAVAVGVQRPAHAPAGNKPSMITVPPPTHLANHDCLRDTPNIVIGMATVKQEEGAEKGPRGIPRGPKRPSVSVHESSPSTERPLAKMARRTSPDSPAPPSKSTLPASPRLPPPVLFASAWGHGVSAIPSPGWPGPPTAPQAGRGGGWAPRAGAALTRQPEGPSHRNGPSGSTSVPQGPASSPPVRPARAQTSTRVVAGEQQSEDALHSGTPSGGPHASVRAAAQPSPRVGLSPPDSKPARPFAPTQEQPRQYVPTEPLPLPRVKGYGGNPLPDAASGPSAATAGKQPLQQGTHLGGSAESAQGDQRGAAPPSRASSPPTARTVSPPLQRSRTLNPAPSQPLAPPPPPHWPCRRTARKRKDGAGAPVAPAGERRPGAEAALPGPGHAQPRGPAWRQAALSLSLLLLQAGAVWAALAEAVPRAALWLRPYCPHGLDGDPPGLGSPAPCRPCPLHGRCTGGRLGCVPGFQVAFGRCVQDHRLERQVARLVRPIRDHVCQQRAREICGDWGGSEWVSEGEIRDELLRRGLGLREGQSGEGGFFAQLAWLWGGGGFGAGVGDHCPDGGHAEWLAGGSGVSPGVQYAMVVESALQRGAQGLGRRQDGHGVREFRCPDTTVGHYMTATCRLSKWAQANSGMLLGVALLAAVVALGLRAWLRRRARLRRAEELYHTVCAELEHLAHSHLHGRGRPWVVAGAVRDALLSVSERSSGGALWREVEQLVGRDSRILIGQKLVKGEPRVVWEWQAEGVPLSAALKARQHSPTAPTQGE